MIRRILSFSSVVLDRVISLPFFLIFFSLFFLWVFSFRMSGLVRTYTAFNCMRMPVDDSCGKREGHGIHTPACLPFCSLEMMKVDDLFNEELYILTVLFHSFFHEFVVDLDRTYCLVHVAV